MTRYFKNPVTRLPRVLFFSHIKWFRILVRVLGYLDVLLFPLYSYLVLEFIHYNGAVRFMNFLKNRTPAVVFGLFVVYFLYFVILLICKKGYIASLITALATTLIAFADYFKYALTGDYLYPWDVFAQTGNIGELASLLSTPVEWWMWVLVLGFAVAIFVQVVSKPEIPVKAFLRLPLALVLAFLVYNSVSTPEKVQKVLNENSLYLEDMALQTSNYSANGFVGAFVVNLLSSNVEKPENYSEEYIDKTLGGYEFIAESEDFESPDIILVLSESFWDVRLLPGVEFSENPLSNWDEVTGRENTVSGRFFTTGFGGGTVRPEFDVLTGLTTDKLPSGSVPWQYITKSTESYVSLYKDLGYTTVAMHPYTSSFYLRKEAYPLIGFDELYFEDTFYNHPDIPCWVSGKQINDATLVNHIKNYLDFARDPVFLFGISMENHQPYTNKYDEHEIEVVSSPFDEKLLLDVQNYANGLLHADRALGALVEYIDAREKPTVLVWFGDHLPTLGSNYAAYNQSGMINTSAMTVEMKEAIQSTPYLIYSNFEFKEDAMVSVGDNNDISSYNLLNALSTLIGSPRTPLMQYLEQFYNVFPYYNVRLFKNLFPEEIWEYVEKHATITYDRVAGNKYSEK